MSDKSSATRLKETERITQGPGPGRGPMGGGMVGQKATRKSAVSVIRRSMWSVGQYSAAIAARLRSPASEGS